MHGGEGAEDRCRMCSMFIYILKAMVIFYLIRMVLVVGWGDASEDKGSDDIDLDM